VRSYMVRKPSPCTHLIRQVPGSSIKMLEKSRSLVVDCVAYDLEDSVTLSMKADARRNILELLNRPRAPAIREQAVRINSMSSGLAEDDLREVVTHQFHGQSSRD